MKAELKVECSPGRLSARVASLGRSISRDYAGHTVGVVLNGGYARKEVFFSHQPQLKDRDVVLLDAVLHSDVTRDFLLKGLPESRPRSLRMAVLVDKPQDRKVDLTPAYFGFVGASKQVVGYGLPGRGDGMATCPMSGILATPEGVAQQAGLEKGPVRGPGR